MKTKEVNEMLKKSLVIAEKNYYDADKVAKEGLQKQLVLKNQTTKKENAILRYKSQIKELQEQLKKAEGNDFIELRARFENQNRMLMLLKEELRNKSKCLIEADIWNKKSMKEKSALRENLNRLEDPLESEKLKSLQQLVKKQEREIEEAKKTNEMLAMHIFKLKDKVAEIPALENTIQILMIQLDKMKTSSFYMSMQPNLSGYSNPMPTQADQSYAMNKQMNDMMKKVHLLYI